MTATPLDLASARAALCGDGRVGLGHGFTHLNTAPHQDVSSEPRMDLLFPRPGRAPGEMPGFKQLVISAGDEAQSLRAVRLKGPQQSTVQRYLQFDLGADTVVYLPPGDLAWTLGFTELDELSRALRIPVRSFNPEIRGLDPNRVWPLHEGRLARTGQEPDSFLVLPEEQLVPEFLGRAELGELARAATGNPAVLDPFRPGFQLLRHQAGAVTLGPPDTMVRPLYADTAARFRDEEPLGQEDLRRVTAEDGVRTVRLTGNVELAQRLLEMPAGRQALLAADGRVFVVDHGTLGPVALDLGTGTSARLPAAPEDLRLTPLDDVGGLAAQLDHLFAGRPGVEQQFEPRLLGGARKADAETRSPLYEIGAAFPESWRTAVLAAAARSRHPLITVGSAGRRLSTAQAGQLTGLLAQLVTQKLTPVVVTNAPLNADLRRIVDAGNVALVRQRQTGIADREWMFRLPKADDEESLGPMLTPDALVAAAARAPRDLAASMDLRLGEWLTMQPALRPEFFARNEAALVSSMESLSGLAGAIDDLPGRVATLPKAGQPEVESLEAAGLAEGSLTALRLARRTELAGEVMAVLGAPDSTTRITTALRLVGQVPPDDLVSLAAGHGQVQAVVRAAAKLHDMKSTDPAGAAKAAAQSITALRPWFRADTKAGDVPHVVNALAAEAERLSTEHPADAEYWRTGYSALMAAVLSCE